MRCAACDVLLTEAELQRKDPATGEYYDLCAVCYTSVKSAVTELHDGFSTPPEDTSH